MSKGFEPAIPLPVIQPSMEERLATLALCEKFGWPLSPDLQQLKNERDIVASAGFSRPPVGTIEERAAKIKADAALMFDKQQPSSPAPTYIVRANAESVKKLEAELRTLQEGQ